MTKRILVALCGALLCVGAALAQPPAGPTPPPGPALTDGQAPFLTPGPVGVGLLGEGQFWGSADYVLGWVQATDLPPLVTTSPVGTPRASAGVLGQPNTSTLFDGRANDRVRMGLRLGGGFWFDPEHVWGVEAGGTILESQSTLFSANSNEHPILARPYLNALTNSPDAILIAFPGSSTGWVEVRASSGNFYEAHLDVSESFVALPWVHLDSILGYRFYRYDEGLTITQEIFPTGANVAPGTEVVTRDSFGANNEFHGGDLGLRARFNMGDLSLAMQAKVAIGNLHREVKIRGNQLTTAPGLPPSVQPAGAFALASNIGTFKSNDWEALPELGTVLSWQVTPGVKLRLGYSVLWLTQIARAAEQVDLTVNPNLFPPAQSGTPRRPTLLNNRDDIWLQTLNLGAEITF